MKVIKNMVEQIESAFNAKTVDEKDLILANILTDVKQSGDIPTLSFEMTIPSDDDSTTTIVTSILSNGVNKQTIPVMILAMIENAVKFYTDKVNKFDKEKFKKVYLKEEGTDEDKEKKMKVFKKLSDSDTETFKKFAIDIIEDGEDSPSRSSFELMCKLEQIKSLKIEDL